MTFRARALWMCLVGCIAPDLLSDQPCPCGSGWYCDETTNRCRRGESADATPDSFRDAFGDVSDAGDANPDGSDPLRACWRRPEGCSWAEPGFRFEEISSNVGDVFGSHPTFSPDACTIMYGDRAAELYERHRPGPGEPFGVPMEMRGLNDEGTGGSPSIAPYGLEMFFASSRGSGSAEIYRSTRPVPDASWITPVRASDLLLDPDVATVHFDPRLSPDGLRIYFAPLVEGPLVRVIYVAERDVLGVAFGGPRPIDIEALELPAEVDGTYVPTATADGRVLIFGTTGARRDLMYTTRADTTSDWTPARLVPTSILTTSTLAEADVSPDGCELIVRAGRTAHLVYVDAM